MSFPGELRRLAAIAQPDVAIELRVAPAHLLNFSSVDEIALAKRELVEGLKGPNSRCRLECGRPARCGDGCRCAGKSDLLWH